MRMKSGIGLAIVILIILALSINLAMAKVIEEKNNDDKIKSLFNPIDKEIRSYIKTNYIGKDKRPSTEISQFSQDLKIKYDSNLDKIVDELENEAAVKLSADQRKELINIMVDDYFDKIYQEEFLASKGLTDQNAKHYTAKRIENASTLDQAVALASYNGYRTPFIYVETKPDVDGGAGIDNNGLYYDVNGHNEPYDLAVWDTSTYLMVQIKYRDEDHPNSAIDLLYDLKREHDNPEYGIEDRALFVRYKPSNNLELQACGSQGNTYATPVGIHGWVTYNGCTANTIYSSNIWNHDIDITDTNPSMQKIYYDF